MIKHKVETQDFASLLILGRLFIINPTTPYLFLVRRKFKHYGVHAKALISGWWAIVEYMTKMRVAATTEHLSATHAMRGIALVPYTARTEGFEEAGPAAAAGKLSIRLKERIAANCAVVHALRVCFVVFAGEGIFGTLIAGYIVHLGRQYLLPLGITYL